MTLKILLVYLDQSERGSLRLRLAAELARRLGGRLIALYLRGLSQAQFARRRSAELGLRSFNEMERLDRRMADSIANAAELLRTELEHIAQRDQLSIEWREMDADAADELIQLAGSADACIVGQDAPNDVDSIGGGLGEELLFQGSRPVLFIPAAGQFSALGRNILIAWDSSPTASRAVRAAMPLLEHADAVTVVAINPSELAPRRDAPGAEELVEDLKQHGVRAAEVNIEAVAASAIAETLQGKALELRADLVVAGAYGHARWREKLLGGVTRDLLVSMKLPLMLAH
jgi:nucleotide-binding universal stress UspA family protein